MSTSTQSTGGVSFLALLFLTFLTLKLCGVIDWSWWWVTAPLWGAFATIAFLAILFVFALVISTLIKVCKDE